MQGKYMYKDSIADRRFFFCKTKDFYRLQQNKITMNILKIKLQVEHYLSDIFTIAA